MSAAETYLRTIVVPTLELTSRKQSTLDKAFEEYHIARKEAASHFEKHNPAFMSYEDRGELRKEISSHSGVNLPSRAVRHAVETVKQNYEHAYATDRTIDPRPSHASLLPLDAQISRLFVTDNRYYLNVKTGDTNVSLPLETTEDDYHQSYLPNPDSLPPKTAHNQQRPGTSFSKIDSEDFPDDTVSLKKSTLHRDSENRFVAHLTFECEAEPRTESITDVDYLVGVSLLETRLATAALYDIHDDHVVDWYHEPVETTDPTIRSNTDYQQQRNYETANRIVDFALSAPDSAGIVLPEQTTIDDHSDIENWTTSHFTTVIKQKATEAGLPVTTTEKPTVWCSRCSGDVEKTKEEDFVVCRECGYQNDPGSNSSVRLAKLVLD